jgi:hypothetical protein
MKKLLLMLVVMLGACLFWALQPAHNTVAAKDLKTKITNHHNNENEDDNEGGAVKLPGYRIIKSMTFY